MGSSPLARGLPWGGGYPHTDHGIIPARAGFTRCGASWLRSCGDHPRSRGVYVDIISINGAWNGSSPLARGLHPGGADGVPRGRIIPARAGFTPNRDTPGRITTDHPRSRGVYSGPAPTMRAGQGSSPLARGLRTRLLRWDIRPGIIPARAGFTRTPPARPRPPADHPRSRGVYSQRQEAIRHAFGSSPLARGLP